MNEFRERINNALRANGCEPPSGFFDSLSWEGLSCLMLAVILENMAKNNPKKPNHVKEK